MNHIIIEAEECKGCRLCVEFCPKTCITISPSFNRMGYQYAEFKSEKCCTACGICEKVCPVSNITIANGKPAWHNRCQQCLACLQWCPAEAIQYGKSTEGRTRYRHPQSKAQDFLMR